MLLYVTLEEVLGGEKERKDVAPPAPPSTLAALYDAGMRRHDRRAVLTLREGDRSEPWPDWRLDRLVIRLALYCREHLHLEPGDRVALLGPLNWLWPAVDFAAIGFGAVPVGLEHDLADDDLAQALADAAPRVAFATDAASASRLLGQRSLSGAAVIVPSGGPADAPNARPLAHAIELGSTLDTPERAQSFRALSRSLQPESAALWHFGPRVNGSPGVFTRLTHAAAMEQVAARAALRPARSGDSALIVTPQATLLTRLAYCGFVGDGHTTTSLGGEGGAPELLAVRPHRIVATGPWLDRAWVEVEAASDSVLRRLARLAPRSAWLRSFDRRGPWVRGALHGRLGERLDFVETAGFTVAAEAFREAGIEVRSQT